MLKMPLSGRPKWNIDTRMMFCNLLNQSCPDPVEDKDPPCIKDQGEENCRNDFCNPQIDRRLPVVVEEK
jgi:hypothetical protein